MASVPSSLRVRSFLSRTDAGSFWLRWAPTFLGFPLGGTLGMVTVGAVSSPATALVGGLLAGAALGAVQWLALRNRLPGIAWIPATAVGQALGLAAGSALVNYQTDLGSLAVQGAVMGAVIGLLQAFVLRRSLAGWFWWALAMPLLWALGWSVTTLAGVQVDQQFTNFGSLGAIVVTILSGLLLTRLLQNPRAKAA